MYKGNIQDFVEELSRYVYERYGARIVYGKKWPCNDRLCIGVYKNYRHGGSNMSELTEIVDAEDIEEQIIDIVKKMLNLKEL